MNVIVGKAPKTPTPVFAAEMRFTEFSPYWNVPPSIARGETIPKLRRDPGYFEQQGFEFVTGDGRVDSGLSEGSLDAVLARPDAHPPAPGPRKMRSATSSSSSPTSDNIYLHHTPAPQLFGRDRRDFSHGCIRVAARSNWRDSSCKAPEWTEERIGAAMAAGRSATLRLAEPLPVVIAYGTAIVREGPAYFFDDIYGRDRCWTPRCERASVSRLPAAPPPDHEPPIRTATPPLPAPYRPYAAAGVVPGLAATAAPPCPGGARPGAGAHAHARAARRSSMPCHGRYVPESLGPC